ncbi:CBS domain-containing protein [Aerococcaceae bacterium zg-BR9]|uniref:cyclic di-AMP binding protein CbpA n=1 Tax=Aerococcaceae bacterium zg-1292 TaxID=2774330 RepID=UPI0040640142|nr:CBS domain-containing protein [Aerococcaceae bacterium zg-BR9]
MIEALTIPKQKLTCINEQLNCQEAIQLLESKGLRCAPVIDATNSIYRGTIYRYHIYQHLFRYPDADLSSIPVTRFLKNTTKVVRVSDNAIRLLFVIGDLPQIAVLSEQNTFVGIIEHSSVLQFFAEAWLSHTGKFVLEITSSGRMGELNRLTKLINRYTDIVSAMTLDETSFDTPSKALFVLPEQFDIVQLNDLERLLQRKKYCTKHHKIK